MSDFQLTFEKRHGYLFVKGKGVRKNLLSIFESTKAFNKIVEETASKFILLDYSELITHVSNHDVFNITRLYETQAPLLYQLTISIVINSDELHLEKFWEEICRQRGFNFKIFTDTVTAGKWLLDQLERTPKSK